MGGKYDELISKSLVGCSRNANASWGCLARDGTVEVYPGMICFGRLLHKNYEDHEQPQAICNVTQWDNYTYIDAYKPYELLEYMMLRSPFAYTYINPDPKDSFKRGFTLHRTDISPEELLGSLTFERMLTERLTIAAKSFSTMVELGIDEDFAAVLCNFIRENSTIDEVGSHHKIFYTPSCNTIVNFMNHEVKTKQEEKFSDGAKQIYQMTDLFSTGSSELFTAWLSKHSKQTKEKSSIGISYIKKTLEISDTPKVWGQFKQEFMS